MPRPPMGRGPHMRCSARLPLPATGPEPRGVADLTSTRLPDSSCIDPTWNTCSTDESRSKVTNLRTQAMGFEKLSCE